MTAFQKIDTRERSLPLPGTCKACGSSTKEIYLDTGTQEEFYGAILYCHECVGYFASLFGFIHPDKALELRTIVEKSYADNVILSERNKQLLGAIDDLVRSGYDGSAINFEQLDLAHLSEITKSEPVEIITISREGEDSVDEGESESDESGSIERLSDLPESEPDKPFSLFG